jgi:peptidoglycan hydrolase-like protein with peptidoglycan-binding domain
VFIRLLSLSILIIGLSGCATSQLKAQNEQLSNRVTDLEKSSQAKDAEIVDLQYQVKDLSSKVDTTQPPESNPAAQGSTDQGEAEQQAPEVLNSTQIIRVKVSIEKIQRALKAAGVYTGSVDGKLGPGTKEAIIEFQKSHGLKADGVLGHRSWEELKKYLR